jgi:hypothetical protein
MLGASTYFSGPEIAITRVFLFGKDGYRHKTAKAACARFSAFLKFCTFNIGHVLVEGVAFPIIRVSSKDAVCPVVRNVAAFVVV